MDFLTLYEGGPRDGILGTMSSHEEPFYDYMVYGSFEEPTKKVNFIVVRMSAKRKGRNWRKAMQVINRMVRRWFSEEDLRYDRSYRYGREWKCIWNIEGENCVTLNPDGTINGVRLWDTKRALRFQWDGK